jgi:hypothetical protein
MLSSHPRGKDTKRPGIAECVDACFDCAQACVTCADACIAENKGDTLARCIRLNQDCAAVCVATAAVLSRVTQPDWQVIEALVRACQTACAACAVECEKHAAMAHCKLCAQSCRAAERTCQVLARAPAMAT